MFEKFLNEFFEDDYQRTHIKDFLNRNGIEWIISEFEKWLELNYNLIEERE